MMTAQYKQQRILTGSPSISFVKNNQLVFRTLLMKEILRVNFKGKQLKTLYYKAYFDEKRKMLKFWFSDKYQSLEFSKSNLMRKNQITFQRMITQIETAGVCIEMSKPYLTKTRFVRGAQVWEVKL